MLIEEGGYLFPKTHIPNVRNFHVEALSNHHPVFLRKGIRKRKYAPFLEIRPYMNKTLNRYIETQFIRLNKSVDNPAKFWRIAEHLLNRSDAYLVLLMNNVFPQWHRKRSYGSVWTDIKNYRKLNLSAYTYKERSIPKADGGTRYLGIPSTHWRLYLHGLQQILQVYLRPYAHPSQHAYQTGKGTLTAWKDILSNVLKSPNIVEYDLTKYFDTINLDYLEELLTQLYLPPALVRHFISWSRSSPENFSSSRYTWRLFSEEAKDYHYYKTKQYVELTNAEVIKVLAQKRTDEKTQPSLKLYEYFHGVPQGGSVSPLLSTLALTKELFLNPKAHFVGYADDGMAYDYAYADTWDLFHFSPASGIKLNRKKSKVVKQEGLWQCELKFCGQIFNPFPSNTTKSLTQGGELKNATRTSRPYTFEDYELIDRAAQYDWWYERKKGQYPYTVQDWFHSKYLGFVQSRIFAGELNLESIIQDFTYTFKKWSWSDLALKRQRPFLPLDQLRWNGVEDTTKLNIFNSSSYSALALYKRIHHEISKKAISDFQE